MKPGGTGSINLSFSTLIKQYSYLQQQVLSQIKSLASSVSGAAPGKFLLVQFGMSQLTQIGDSISNMISQVNSVLNNSVRNQKSS
jgi:hypothetical protein